MKRIKNLAARVEAETREQLRILIQIPTGEWLDVAQCAIRTFEGERCIVLRPDTCLSFRDSSQPQTKAHTHAQATK